MKIDLHVHTVVSGHAYSTVREDILEAKEKGLQAIAITDHGPQMPGVTDFFHAVNSVNAIPKIVEGVRVVHGFEANIISRRGEIDMPPEFTGAIEYILGALHGVCLIPASKEINTRTLINAMQNQMVDAIAHPDDPVFAIDYKLLALNAAKYKVALEVNNTSLKGQVRKDCRKCTLEMLKWAKEYNVYIVCGSDAHFYTEVGALSLAEEILKEVDYDPSLVVNNSLEQLEAFLQLRKKERVI